MYYFTSKFFINKSNNKRFHRVDRDFGRNCQPLEVALWVHNLKRCRKCSQNVLQRHFHSFVYLFVYIFVYVYVEVEGIYICSCISDFGRLGAVMKTWNCV